jgi:hypothetical protein
VRRRGRTHRTTHSCSWGRERLIYYSLELHYVLISCLWNNPASSYIFSRPFGCFIGSPTSTDDCGRRTWYLRHPILAVFTEEFATRWNFSWILKGAVGNVCVVSCVFLQCEAVQIGNEKKKCCTGLHRIPGSHCHKFRKTPCVTSYRRCRKHASSSLPLLF